MSVIGWAANNPGGVKQFICLGLNWSYQAPRVIRVITFAARFGILFLLSFYSLARNFDAARIFLHVTAEPPRRFR